MVELAIVLGVIGLLAAVALPNILAYLRTYRIRGGAQQVLGELQTARAQAIKRNVNIGVVFWTISPTTYRYVIEDDVLPQQAPDWGGAPPGTIDTLPAVNQGPIRTLPDGVAFDTTTAPAPNDRAVRFGYLGTACDPGATNCLLDADIPPGVNYLMNDACGTWVTLIDQRSGMRQRINVSLGGRPRILPGFPGPAIPGAPCP